MLFNAPYNIDISRPSYHHFTILQTKKIITFGIFRMCSQTGREVMTERVIAIPSSIALLQERFRQLQRAKEIREEREFLKMVAYTENRFGHSLQRESAGGLFFQPESIIHKPSSPPHVSLSLWPDSQLQSQQGDFQFVESPRSLSFPSSQEAHAHAKNSPTMWEWDKRDDCVSDDIDTSLHL